MRLRAAAGQVADACRLCWVAGPRTTVLLVGLAVVGGLVPVGLVWLTKLLLDGVTGRGPAVPAVVGGLVALGLASAVIAPARTLLRADLRRAIDLQVQTDLHDAVNRLDGMSRLEDAGFRNRLQMARSCSGPSLTPATVGLFDIGADVLALVGMMATLLVLSPAMAVVVSVAAVPALIAELSFSNQQVALTAGLSETMRRRFFYSSLLVDLNAAKEVRLLGLAPFLSARLRRALAATQVAAHRLDLRVGKGQALLGLLGAAVAGSGIAWAAAQAMDQRFSAGDLSAFVAAVAGVQGTIVSLVGRVGQAGQALGYFRYYREILMTPNDLPVSPGGGAVPALRRGVELRHVWFRYGPDRPWVLRDVSLTIPFGATVGLVGLNGAGKSTLVKLLCRLYDPTRGTILWDGLDIRSLPVAAVRDRIGALFQDFMAYDLTAGENIGVGDVEHVGDLRRIRAAADEGGVDSLIRGLPAGYGTMLSRLFSGNERGEDGREKEAQDGRTLTLSGGQWQRIALARALMRGERDLLLLDEPGSGLDPEAEHDVNRRLLAYRTGRTNVLITHRLGVLRQADRIVCLADGTVAETGTHEELMAAGGGYAHLFTLQSEPYAASGR